MVDGVFMEILPEDIGWRFMLGLAAVPSIIMLIGFLFYLPESPRWLAMSNQPEVALAVLKSIRDTDQDAIDELNDILQSVGKERIQIPSRTTISGINTDGNSLYEHDCNIVVRNANSPTNRRRIVTSNNGTSLEYGSSSITTEVDNLRDTSEMDELCFANVTTVIHQSTDATMSLVHDNKGDDGHVSFHIQFFRMLSDVPTRRALILGCGLMLIQQCSGVNT
jgi:Sugar (and other) transporter